MRGVGTPEQATNDMAISRDGRIIVTVGDAIRRWQFDGTLLGTQSSRQSAGLFHVDISPDATTIVSGGMLPSQLELWNAADGSYLKNLPERASASSVMFVPDSQTLLISSNDDIHTVRITDLNTTHYPSRIGRAIIAPDGNLVASDLTDYSIQVWCLRP